MTPASFALRAARNVPFVSELRFTYQDEPVDLSGYTGTLQVRLYPGAGGSALISLTNVTTNVQGVRVQDGGAVRIQIDEATLDTLPQPAEAGGDLTLSYDLVLTDTASLQQRWAAGSFILSPGVTD